jgi:hypothetical protein
MPFSIHHFNCALYVSSLPGVQSDRCDKFAPLAELSLGTTNQERSQM